MASGSVPVELSIISFFDTLDASSDSWKKWGYVASRRLTYCLLLGQSVKTRSLQRLANDYCHLASLCTTR